MAADERKMTFHSAETLELEEGGTAHVSLLAYRDSGGIRTHVTVEPGDATLTDRDVGILAGLLLGAAFAPPYKPPVEGLIEPLPSTVAA